jgi:rhamnosyltransferase
MNSRVCAITISYNPDLEMLHGQLRSLSGQCRVVVVDNGSAGDMEQSLGDLCAEHAAGFLALHDNYGIARAQNAGVAFVRERYPDCEYLLFLDHDSVPDAGFVDALLARHRSLDKDGKTGAVGPAIFEPRAGSCYGFHVIRGLRYLRILPADMLQDTIECATINSSGTLCTVAMFAAVGGYDEQLFIDHVETEWCFRARQAGFRHYGVRSVMLPHHMGDDVMTFRLFGKTVTMPYRNPLRHRYLVRNSVLLLKRPYIPRVWKFYCVAKLVVTLVLFGFFSDESKAQRHSILQGLRDGINGVTGRIPVQEGTAAGPAAASR